MPFYPSIEDDGYPDDWYVPSSSVPPAPAPSASFPLASTAYPAASYPNAPPVDPFASYRAWLSATSLGSAPWNPPSLPDSSGQSALTPPASPPLNVPWSAGENGLFGAFGRMMAEREQAKDPWQLAANSLVGGIAKLTAAQPAK